MNLEPKSESAAVASPLIVVTFEGFTPSSLGCYGSSWNVTPTIDRIASQGAVWDRLIATDDDPLDVFLRWCREDCPLESFRSRGSVELVTDDVRLDTDEIEDLFDVLGVVTPEPSMATCVPAEGIEHTHLAQLILTAMERLSEAEPSDPIGLLWIHSRFLSTRWDAPRDLVSLDEMDDVEVDQFDDAPSEASASIADTGGITDSEYPPGVPMVYEDVVPPNVVLDDRTHPDVVTSWMRTYACQIRLIDELLGVLLRSNQEHTADVLIAGTSGFELGQNGTIGHRVGPVRSSSIRLPMIVCRRDGGDGASSLRVPQLVDSGELTVVLSRLADPASPVVTTAEWSRHESEFEPGIVIRSERCQTAVQTPRWFCVVDAGSDPNVEQEACLFLKPDDVDDVNDISRLRIDVVDELLSIATRKNPSGTSFPMG